MAKIIVFTNLSLDGVMQAPAHPEEDLRNGFKHGGWAAPYAAMREGSGRRLFPDGGAGATLRLISNKATSTGVVVATYEPVHSNK
jgi:hypothetical protein